MPKGKGPRKFWTTKEIKLLREYAAEGLSIARAARLLGRPRGATGAAASRYGITFCAEDWGAPYGNHNRKGKKTKNAPRTNIGIAARRRKANFHNRQLRNKKLFTIYGTAGD